MLKYIFDITDAKDTMMISLEQDDTATHTQSGDKINYIGFHIMRQ